jgi:hypothetical protein
MDLTVNSLERSIEEEILNKGLTAPRVTPDSIRAKVKKEQFYVFPDSTLTVCMLTLENGFTVLGESACASPENFEG